MLRLCVLLLIATPSIAEPVVHRLTPEAVEAAKASGAERNRAAEALVLDDDDAPRSKVHGEVGFGIGTGGAREAFGSAVVPLGETGTAAFDFDYSRFNPRLGYRNR